MPVEISWQQPGRVLYERYYGTDVLASMAAAQQPLEQELNENEGPIHVIVDLSDITEAPHSMVEMRSQLLFNDMQIQKLGYVVFVKGKNPVIQYFVSILSQVTLKGTPHTFLDTREEAIQYLHGRDETVRA